MPETYPLEIKELLRLGQEIDHGISHGDAHADTNVPHDLPMSENQEAEPKSHDLALDLMPKAKKIFNKSLLVYPAIFLAAFVFFYAVLNFFSLISQVQGWFTKPQDQEILGDNTGEFYNWISGYYFAVGDASLLEPNNDIDKDGLTNIDEFVIKTNPIITDSDSDGFSDGIEIINGYNPWGEGRMSEKQKKLAEDLDLIKINNRISFNASELKKGQQTLGAQTINYDLNKPGVLSIPKLNLQVPLIWTRDPVDFENDLTRGLVHYPGTAMPGENGMVYISGHSSDYLWKKHPYRQVFARINALTPGDDIFVELYGLDGKTYNYRYKVAAEKVYRPDDQAQFIDSSGKRLNLSTCWPIGTQKDRYVVTAELGMNSGI